MRYEATWKNICIIGGILSIIAGVIAVFIPAFFMKSLSLIIGLSVLFFGAANLYDGFSQIDVLIIGAAKITFSLICVIVGLVFLINPQTPYKLFAVCFGFWSVVNGALKLNVGLSLKKNGENYLALIINGIINVMFGILIIFFPITVTAIWTQIFGVYFIYLGANLLLDKARKKNIR